MPPAPSAALPSSMEALQSWYEQLDRPRSGAGLPAKGSLAIGLIILDRLRTVFDFTLNSHMAPGGAQIQGASGRQIREILARFGETRPFSREGGRTNSGTPKVAKNLLKALSESDLVYQSNEERDATIMGLEQFVVNVIWKFPNVMRLKPAYDPIQSTRSFIGDLLSLAHKIGIREPVARNLVGALLQLSFSDAPLREEADMTGQPGGFMLGDSTFQVAVVPTNGVYETCVRNLAAGKRVFLLVPDALVFGARQYAEVVAVGRMAVESIESFVAQNVEVLSHFTRGKVATVLRLLLETYNARVNALEIDKSILIKAPTSLAELDAESASAHFGKRQRAFH